MTDSSAPGKNWTMRGVHTSAEINGGVLVGDDGSDAAVRAVEYAVEEAARRGTDLHVLRAWTIPTAVRPHDLPFGVTPSILEFQEATKAQTLGRATDAGADHPDMQIHAHTVYGRGDQALIGASAGADVLVVGSRGLSRIGNFLIGSTAAACIRQAPVPVVVVR